MCSFVSSVTLRVAPLLYTPVLRGVPQADWPRAPLEEGGVVLAKQSPTVVRACVGFLSVFGCRSKQLHGQYHGNVSIINGFLPGDICPADTRQTKLSGLVVASVVRATLAYGWHSPMHVWYTVTG